MITFTKIEADYRSGSLACELDGVTTAKIKAAFGAFNKSAYYSPEDGYYGEEYTFKASNGAVYSVYSRFGGWRIGAPCGRGDQNLSAFVAFLQTALPGLTAVGVDLAMYQAKIMAHKSIQADFGF